jgi:hypothetical protein
VPGLLFGGRMKIKIIEQCFINNQPAQVGDVIEISGDAGKAIIAAGRAKEYTETPEAKPISKKKAAKA